MSNLTQFLRLGFFLLMCIGLLLASVFLWYGKLAGSEWVTICSILFSADRISNGVTEGIMASRKGVTDAGIH